MILSVLFLANILAVIGWWYFFQEINREKEKITAARFESEKINIKINNVKNLVNLLKSFEKEQNLISGTFIGEKNLVVFIEELEKIALMSNVELAVMNASLPRKDEISGPTFRISLQGEFEEVYRFSDLLTNAPYQILLEKFSLRRVSVKKDGERPWQADLEITVLSYNFKI